MAGERIQEALELGLEDLHVVQEWEASRARNPGATLAPPQRNPVFAALGGISAEEHVLSVLRRVRASALRDALLTLPFATVPALFTFLRLFAERRLDVPLTCRVLFLALRAHHRQLVAARGPLRTDLERLRRGLRAALTEHKHRLGFNLAALRVVDRQILDAAVKDYVDDTWDDDAGDGGDQKKKKRAFVHVS